MALNRERYPQGDLARKTLNITAAAGTEIRRTGHHIVGRRMTNDCFSYLPALVCSGRLSRRSAQATQDCRWSFRQR